MYFHVLLKVWFSIRGILTEFTIIWFFPSMNHKMLFEVGNGFGYCRTMWTTQSIWAKVNWNILKTIKNGIRKQNNFSISILVCKISTDILMNFHVFLKVWISIWRILTMVAIERFFSGVNHYVCFKVGLGFGNRRTMWTTQSTWTKVNWHFL